ncbi:MAG TPA: dihydroorotate dehydrogenase electron transfer subunit [Polyangiaceae bacterium]
MSSALPARRRLVTLPLLRRESIGDSYHVLSFDDREGTTAEPGQFVMVRGAEWGDAPLLPRPMSYLTAGHTPSILIKVIGEGTLRMGRAEPGEPFTLLGPLGLPWRTPSPGRRPVLVGGGVGIAPLLFLARALATPGSGPKPLAIYGGRTARDLPLDDDLAELAELRITTEDGSRGTRGRVTDVLAELLGPDKEVFTCGPDRMMAKVAELCAARDVPCEVSLETPMACGYGVCLGCPVPTSDGGYLYACTQGPCVNARRVDWSRADHAPKKGLVGTRSAP